MGIPRYTQIPFKNPSTYPSNPNPDGCPSDVPQIRIGVPDTQHCKPERERMKDLLYLYSQARFVSRARLLMLAFTLTFANGLSKTYLSILQSGREGLKAIHKQGWLHSDETSLKSMSLRSMDWFNPIRLQCIFGKGKTSIGTRRPRQPTGDSTT
jgi:hypothetical protein